MSQHCSHVPWTLHADDDVLIDIFLLHQFAQRMDDHTRKQFTCRMVNGVVFRDGKWAVTSKEFAPKKYSDYCQGTVWLLATSQVPKLLQASKKVNFVWIDDFYITGLLAREVNITINDIVQHLSIKPYNRRTDLGNIVSWYHFKEVLSRTEAWKDILHFHQNHREFRQQVHKKKKKVRF